MSAKTRLPKFDPNLPASASVNRAAAEARGLVYDAETQTYREADELHRNGVLLGDRRTHKKGTHV